MRKHGFTLAELMVAISISGLLTAVAVPKLSSSISKSKATELTPAAATYTKLQAAYLYEHKSFGTWKKIGYEAPGKRGKTTPSSTPEAKSFPRSKLTTFLRI